MPNAKRKCKTCQKYHRYEDGIVIGLSFFCSFECYKKSFSSEVSSVYKKEQIGHDEVRKADGFLCRVCGRPGQLISHHIYYRSESEAKSFLNDRHNLISLHNEPCHLTVVHGDKNRFKPLLLGLVWKRECENDNSMTVFQLEEKLGANDDT